MGGFSYIGTDGGDSGQRIRKYTSDAAARKIAVGDPVLITGTASAAGNPVATTTSGDVTTKLTGIVVGFVPDFANEALSANGVAASTACEMLVCDDGFALFEVDSDTTLAVTDVGSNIGTLYTATSSSGNIYTSNIKLKAASVGTTAALPFQIVKLITGSTGTLGERAVVRLNESTMRPGATGV